MRVLITGGTGFVGLAAAEALAARGAELVLFGLSPIPDPFRAMPVWRDAEVLIGDVRSPDAIARALAFEPTHLLHAAAVTPDEARERADPEGIGAVNLGGTLNVVQAAAALKPPPRLVVLSSAAAYGITEPGPDGLYDEVATRPEPAALYGITKLAAERAALRLAALHGLDLTAIRLGAVFGPWEHRSGARDLMSPHLQVLDAALSGRPVRLPWAMGADWIYSRDAGAGIAEVLLGGAASPVVNLGGAAVTDLAAWCGLVAAEMPGLDWEIGTPEDATIRYVLARPRPSLSNARLFAETAFRHRFGLPAALRDNLAWRSAIGAG